MKEYKLDDFWFSDKDNALKIYDILFRWMLYKKFTLTTANINEEYLVKELKYTEEQMEARKRENPYPALEGPSEGEEED